MATKSAAEKRAEAKHEYDAFLAACPTRQVVATLADKWACLVVNALADEPKRHGELMRMIAGASQKMLTQTLRTLERDGIVSRSITASVPVRVDYALTDLGESIMPVLRALKAWSEANIEDVLAARAAYDKRVNTSATA